MADERRGHFLCKRTRWEIDTADAPCALTNCPFSGSASNMSQEETDRRIAEMSRLLDGVRPGGTAKHRPASLQDAMKHELEALRREAKQLPHTSEVMDREAIEAAPRKPIKTLADVMAWLNDMALAKAYFDDEADQDAIEAQAVLRALTPPPEAGEDTIANAASAIMDVFCGGDPTWRSRIERSMLLESADWARAVELARAALLASPSPKASPQEAEGWKPWVRALAVRVSVAFGALHRNGLNEAESAMFDDACEALAELIGTGLLAASPTPQEAGREG